MVVVGFVKPAQIRLVHRGELREVLLAWYAWRERHQKGGRFGVLLPEGVDITHRGVCGVAGQQCSPDLPIEVVDFPFFDDEGLAEGRVKVRGRPPAGGRHAPPVDAHDPASLGRAREDFDGRSTGAQMDRSRLLGSGSLGFHVTTDS